MEVVYTDASDDLLFICDYLKVSQEQNQHAGFLLLPKELSNLSTDINRVFNSADSLDAEKYLMDY
ncbi:MAG: hypothetical protein IPI39_26000 [Candidatus Obscuribacter sp.]|nr:hypothetical protein [Candidatus Obscuribacter sp.]